MPSPLFFIAQAAVKALVLSAGGMTGVAAFSVALMLNRACYGRGILSVKARIASRHGAPRITACSSASSLRHRLTRLIPRLASVASISGVGPDRFLPMRPEATESVSAHQSGKLLPARPVAAGQRMGA